MSRRLSAGNKFGIPKVLGFYLSRNVLKFKETDATGTYVLSFSLSLLLLDCGLVILASDSANLFAQ